jgi:hypothetical protein
MLLPSDEKMYNQDLLVEHRYEKTKNSDLNKQTVHQNPNDSIIIQCLSECLYKENLKQFN